MKELIEFGSDYHFIANDEAKGCKTCALLEDTANFYVNGRQSIQDLIRDKKWTRIWIPEYFCYDVISSIKETGIQIQFYYDHPGFNEIDTISNIRFRKGDVLFRMNYFGLRSFRDNSDIDIEVIEDHSHDLIGEWATNSNADFCIASLRKSLPIADGGILWSPNGHKLPTKLSQTEESKILVALRYKAMKDKADYLKGSPMDKARFLDILHKTEIGFSNLPKSSISTESYNIIKYIDIKAWYETKKRNWSILSEISHPKINILKPENLNGYPFSFVLKFNNKMDRDFVRSYLIDKNVYPAILWTIPNTQSPDIVKYGDTYLSLHCDGRYNIKDIKLLYSIISMAIERIDKR